jgi:nucleotide-binding universal stress UspA family protein
MKCILVATDGSKGADRAVDYAAKLAKADSAKLLIVNVIGGYDLPDKVVRAFMRANQAWLQEVLESHSAEILSRARKRAHKAGVTAVEIESRTGEVGETVMEIASEKKADAIIVGKRGAGAISKALLGSVSQKLVSLSPFPVTVVP